MKTTDLSHIRYEVSDVDGVLLPYDRHRDGKPGFIDLCVSANAEAVRNHIPSLSEEDAIRLSLESYRDYTDGVTAFRPIAEEAGKNWEEFKVQLSREYHFILFENLKYFNPEYFSPDSELISAIQAIRDMGYDGSLASHSCRHNWLTPAFNINGMGHLFDPEHRLGMEDLMIPKQDCGKFLHRIADKVDVPLSQMAFLEDTPRNLAQAKKDCPEVTTIYICKTPLDPNDPSFKYIDAQFPTASDFYKKWKHDINTSPAPEYSGPSPIV